MKLFFRLFLSLTFLSTAQAGLVWDEINQEEGITVYSAEVPDNPLVAFKGKVIIEAPAKKILWVLADRKHRRDWVDRLDINDELEIISKVERVIYQSFKMPLFISNRDMVYRSVLSRNKETGVYKFHLFSVEHAKAPETIGVRAELVNSSYLVKPLSANKTEVTVEILSDPKGLLPAWLVNLIQKSWPLKTLRGLRTQVKKDFVKEYDANFK
ncbi:hypothetical protein A9Q84_10240 [Halobacteriovorax marinus]|uniref:START domain-containing protein n=1 Tax=Halobacteriovorax marinus TaxID=97084 RepID=A0A1Y5FDP6_9BACT|nr:hypothetical protein A9Q84_10240 [Halobacteriovorax marinus]